MSKFSEWLDAKRGRSAALVRHLGTHRNQVSRVKLGINRMPIGWVTAIVEFSEGALTYVDLLPKPKEGRK